jgi:hypothetical protein
MAHVRTQLRNAVRQALIDGLPSSEYSVFASRKTMRNVDSKALVDMRFLNDQVRQQETMGDIYIRVASLYIRVQRVGQESTIDNILDQDEVLITAAMEDFNWADVLEEPPELVQVNFSDDSPGGEALAMIVLRYDMEYRIDKSDPETPVP